MHRCSGKQTPTSVLGTDRWEAKEMAAKTLASDEHRGVAGKRLPLHGRVRRRACLTWEAEELAGNNGHARMRRTCWEAVNGWAVRPWTVGGEASVVLRWLWPGHTKTVGLVVFGWPG